jgi:hypothetical protein
LFKRSQALPVRPSYKGSVRVEPSGSRKGRGFRQPLRENLSGEGCSAVRAVSKERRMLVLVLVPKFPILQCVLPLCPPPPNVKTE